MENIVSLEDYSEILNDLDKLNTMLDNETIHDAAEYYEITYNEDDMDYSVRLFNSNDVAIAVCRVEDDDVATEFLDSTFGLEDIDVINN